MCHLNDLVSTANETTDMKTFEDKSQRKIISKFLEEILGVIEDNNIYEEIRATQLYLVLDIIITTPKFKRLEFGKFNESHFIIYD